MRARGTSNTPVATKKHNRIILPLPIIESLFAFIVFVGFVCFHIISSAYLLIEYCHGIDIVLAHLSN
jgi:hypothetical protein